MKKRVISMILCLAMCCAVFPASALAAGPEIQHEENLTPELMAAAPNPNPAVPFARGAYTNGKYFTAYNSLFVNEMFAFDQRTDIVLIARSQIGYHESNSSTDLSGEDTTGTGNYTEYGRYYGNNGVAWGGYFIYWLGRMVKLNQNLMQLTMKAYDRNKIQVGDIVSMRNGQNLGIVTRKDASNIWVTEGNYSDSVKETPYALNNTAITGYASPNYGYWMPTHSY